MPRKARRWVAVVLVLLATLAVPTAGATPAAAASCTANSCNGRDPHSTGCDAASTTDTLAEFTSPEDGYMRVELRRSQPCWAAWARATIDLQGMPRHNYVVLKAYHTASGGTPFAEYWVKITDSSNNTPPGGTRIWTPMHSFTVYVQACLLNNANQGHCTGRH